MVWWGRSFAYTVFQYKPIKVLFSPFTCPGATEECLVTSIFSLCIRNTTVKNTHTPTRRVIFTMYPASASCWKYETPIIIFFHTTYKAQPRLLINILYIFLNTYISSYSSNNYLSWMEIQPITRSVLTVSTTNLQPRQYGSLHFSSLHWVW